jgi:membrane protease YdiL (CAAX protease family)
MGQKSNHQKLMYGISFLCLFILLALRESESFGYIYEFLPIMGTATPFFIFALMLTFIHISSGRKLSDVGLKYPDWDKPVLQVMLIVIAMAIMLAIARVGSAAMLNPLFNVLGVEGQNVNRMAQLAGNTGLLILVLPIMWMVVVCEELVIRGYLMNYIADRLGGKKSAWIAAIIISALIFGLGHFPNGIRGMIGSGIGGLIYGSAYMICRRNLWPGIIGHAAVNTLGFLSAYYQV